MGLLVQLTRPLLRFCQGEASHVVAMPSPLFGRGEWIGQIPEATDIVELSCCHDGQAQEIALEDCYEVGVLGLAWQLLRTRPKQLITALLEGRLEGSIIKALTIEAASRSLTGYHQWRGDGQRSVDLAGIDRPQHDWLLGVHVRYVCRTGAKDAERLRDTIATLQRQLYPHWSLVVAGNQRCAPAHQDSRIMRLPETATIATGLMTDLQGPAIFAPIVAGDFVPPYGAAAIAEYAAAVPRHALIYADEDQFDRDGRFTAPKLKPDWSPEFQNSTHYVGGALYLRDQVVKSKRLSLGELLDPFSMQTLFCGHHGEVGHIRRVLLTRRAEETERSALDPAGARTGTPFMTASRPFVTIVVPTKDRADLLHVCLSSIKRVTDTDLDVVLVDNGSQEQKTTELYKSLSGDARFRVEYRPGPFNFAQLCNDGAAAGRAPILLFLNNDIEATDDTWLGHLLAWVTKPSIGAVGANLRYPSGRLQHGGLVLGLRGNAGHIDIGAPGHAAGYLRQHSAPREVAAVTGACLAVERTKFEAVGGFDAELFPVELNDVDLCLRLCAKGWNTLIVPGGGLIHRESATRGRGGIAEERYPKEHAAFRRRWGTFIFDDPYFHPALALTTTSTSLGG
jgi:O-antigen biosynthesis protein